MKKFLVLSIFWPSLLWSAPSGVAVSTGTCTATVLATSQDNSGNAVVALHFVTNTQTFDINDNIPLGASPAQLNDFVAAECVNLGNQAIAFSTAPAVGQVVPPTPAVTATPDANAGVKQQFLADYQVLKQMQTAVSHGILAAADATLATQLTTVTTELAANRAILLPLIQVGP